jgi:outer membrane protein assembly factor BamD
MQFKPKSFFLFALVSILAGCSDYGKIFKGKNTSLKLAKAEELYAKEDFGRALPLFEQLKDDYFQNKRDSLELAYIKVAYCYFYLKAYEDASSLFKDFTYKFSRSPKVVDCSYMALYCDYLSVADYDLDQVNTVDIINEIQEFMNAYPDSDYVPKCNEHIDNLRGRLHKKAFEQVNQYYQISEFKAASAAAVLALKSYPDIPQKEELEYIAYEAQFLYAMNSVESKRIERLEKAMNLIDDYLESNKSIGAHSSDANETRIKIIKEITKLKEII